jgi:hypothetical protein
MEIPQSDVDKKERHCICSAGKGIARWGDLAVGAMPP